MKYSVLVFLFFVGVYLVPLAGRPLASPGEFRRAAIPRELVQSGQSQLPALLDIRRSEESAISYRITAISMKCFGDNAFGLRFPTALAVGLTALLISGLLLRATGDPRVAALGAVIYLACGLVYASGVFALPVAIFTFLVTGASSTGFLATVGEKFDRQKVWLAMLCGAFASLATAFGGGAGWLIPLVSLTGYLIWARRPKELLLWLWISAIVYFLLLWPWASAGRAAGETRWDSFGDLLNFNRFGGNAPGGCPSWWSCLLVVVCGVFPAGILLSAAIPGIHGERKSFFKDIYAFCAAAILLPAVILVLLGGYHAAALLPCFAFGAALCAGGVASYFRSGSQHTAFHWCMTLWGVLLVELSTVFIIAAGISDISVLLFGVDIAAKLGDRFNPRMIFGEQFEMALMVGSCAVIYGWAMVLSHKALWRSRLYIFFVGIAILALVVPWAIPATIHGTTMPEDSLRAFRQELEFIPADAAVAADPDMVFAVEWVYELNDVVGIDGVAPGSLNSLTLSAEDFRDFIDVRTRPVIFVGDAERFADIAGGRRMKVNGVEVLYFPTAITW